MISTKAALVPVFVDSVNTTFPDTFDLQLLVTNDVQTVTEIQKLALLLVGAGNNWTKSILTRFCFLPAH